jgi:hydrogenase maturation protein HypF
MIARVRVRVEGVVQGVGFRPYVYRLARELAVGGWVRNDDRGVLLEAEGETAAVEAFLARLPAEAPPLASVADVRAQPLPVTGERGFAIVESAVDGAPAALVAPDTATCGDCLRELFDRRTAASATRSSTAPTAGRGSPSCAASRTTGR